MTSQQQNAPRSSARARRSRVNPMASVAVITAAALVGVGVLAVQANGSAPDKAPAPVVAAKQPVVSTNQSGQAVAPAPDPALALPASSGKGKRVVYSLSKSRIWLVGDDEKVQLSAQAVSGTVVPDAGNYEVGKWYATHQGADGAAVQYEVLWGSKKSGANEFAFDAIASLPGDQLPSKPASGTRTGGVRLTQNDAHAVWQFATTKGTAVVVVP
ncbi:hypothetical protein [Catenulispora rubra]|uniref:hypothetical protein n=1 Tax=Catenulispora rubra TaxID=280293 RepID=UPI00189267AE|nr:hypothetical protein [Catenulispora rubra]